MIANINYQDSEAVVVGGVTTIQGIRESRMQGEGLQIWDAETDAETVNNRLIMINVAEEMKHLNELAKSDPSKRFVKLWDKLTSIEWLTQAWEQIRRNKGSQTSGIDKMTDDSIDLELIQRLAESIKQGAYRPKPVRRVYIPKTNGKTRPLGIPTLEDRIIQQALRMLLEPIFEADFYKCSHGFRQGKSTITALRDVAIHYPHSSWIIEGDIKGCFNNIPHGKLIEQISRRVADEKILRLCWKFLKAGYLEQWSYHRTYSGTPQGGIISPLFANIFLHQLDEFLDNDLKANVLQTYADVKSRRNPEYCKIDDKITKLRRKLKGKRTENRREVIKQIHELEKQRRRIPSYARDVRHPGKLWYTRYADDFVILVAGNKPETEAIKEQVKSKLSEMNLVLSDEKTKITHWSKKIQFLGYQIHGKQKSRKVGLRAVLSIPFEKQQQITERIQKTCSYYHIPEIDVLTQVNAMFRGWCNYFKYANQPLRVFKKLGSLTWWAYAHYKARKHKSSIKKMLVCESKAGRYKQIQKGGNIRTTFLENVGKKSVILDIFPPKRAQVRSLGQTQEWKVDLQPVTPMNWASGRSLITRMTAIERAKGICERCKEKPVHQVHHNRPMRGKSFLARVHSDRDQRETATALCKECHLEVHQGSFRPRRSIPNWNAGCDESRLSGVVSAS